MGATFRGIELLCSSEEKIVFNVRCNGISSHLGGCGVAVRMALWDSRALYIHSVRRIIIFLFLFRHHHKLHRPGLKIISGFMGRTHQFIPCSLHANLAKIIKLMWIENFQYSSHITINNSFSQCFSNAIMFVKQNITETGTNWKDWNVIWYFICKRGKLSVHWFCQLMSKCVI
jgi:hypothetical protein